MEYWDRSYHPLWFVSVSINESISFNLFIDLSSATLDLVSFMFLRRVFLFKSIDFKISSIASAPIPAVKDSSPNSSCIYLIHLCLGVDFSLNL